MDIINKMKLNLPHNINSILSIFAEAGYEIYIVGGSVRDLLMDRPVKDWDFTTNAKPEEILELFPDAFYDNKFGTVGVNFEGEKKPYEITTFRTEQGYSDNRRPDQVTWGKSLEEDLKRRDFTINAMALKNRSAIFQGKPSTAIFQGKSSAEFELIDLHNGQKDLEGKLVRSVGDANQRFLEDALRMMRAIRIASELGFMIEENTFSAIVTNKIRILNISWERIRDELFKILKTEYVYDGLTLLKNAGILELILPEVTAGFGVEQASPGRHHIYDVGMHSFLAVKFCPSTDPIVRLATLLHDAGKPQTVKVLPTGTITFYNHEVVGTQIAYRIGQRLRLSKEQLKRMVTLVRWHQFSVDERQTDSAIRRFIRRVGKENIEDMLALRIGDRLGGGATETSWRLEKYKERIEQLLVTPFSVSDMAIDGNDVMKTLGIKPGPKVGEIINKIFEEVMEDHTRNQREYLLKRVEELRNS